MQGDTHLIDRLKAHGAAPWRQTLAQRIESAPVQQFVVSVIIVNAVILGLETFQSLSTTAHAWLHWLDRICLAVLNGAASRRRHLRSYP